MRRRWSAACLRRLINLWPPFRGAGITVRAIAPDWRYVKVELKQHWFNGNYFGTHFGGSLYAMTDPFYTLMLLNGLGDDYLVWDQAAEIEYVKPGRGRVHAEFRLSDAEIAALKARAADGSRVTPEYALEVTDEAGEVVARVRRRLYVRLKKDRRPGAELAG